jgi:hypothetical protein
MKPIVEIGLWVSGAMLAATSAQQPARQVENKTDPAKTYVFIADSYSNNGSATATRPHIVEAINTFGERCRDMSITLKQDEAEYVVLVERDRYRRVGRKRNKVAVVDRGGRVIYSNSTRLLRNAVKDSCHAIREAKSQGGKTLSQPPTASK